MARKRQRYTSTFSAPRDPNEITSPGPEDTFPELFRLRPRSTHPRSGHRLQDIEDRRTWYPGVTRPARTAKSVARLLMALPEKSRSRSMAKEVYSFALPKQTAVCVRREIRKQVIHAKGIGGKKVRRPRRNALSRISCRRK